MRQGVASLLLFALALPSHAQSLQYEESYDDIQLSYGIDRQQLRVGEPLTFTLTVTVPVNAIVQFEAVDDALGSLPVSARYPSGPKATSDDRAVWQRQYVLTPETIGRAEIPSLRIDFFTERPAYVNRRCVGARDCLDLIERRVPPEVRLADSKRIHSTQPIALNIVAADSKLSLGLTQHKYLDGEIELQLDIDRRQMTTDELLRYTLSVETLQRVIPEFQPVGDKLEEFTVVSRHPGGPNKVSGQKHHWQREYILRTEEIGEFTLPALTVAFFTLDKPIEREPCLTAADCPRLSAHDPGPSITFAHTRRELSTDPVTISVSAAPVEDASEASSSLGEQLLIRPLWLGGLLLLIAASVSTLLMRQRRSTAPTLDLSANVQTSSPMAQETLAQLRDLSNPTDNLKDCHQHIDRAVRSYLAQRLTFNALARSSEEIIAHVADSPLAEQLDTLATVLRRCDQVKFADRPTEPRETSDTLALAERFVLATLE